MVGAYSHLTRKTTASPTRAAATVSTRTRRPSSEGWRSKILLIHDTLGMVMQQLLTACPRCIRHALHNRLHHHIYSFCFPHLLFFRPVPQANISHLAIYLRRHTLPEHTARPQVPMRGPSSHVVALEVEACSPAPSVSRGTILHCLASRVVALITASCIPEFPLFFSHYVPILTETPI